jgi:hypothetical protein
VFYLPTLTAAEWVRPGVSARSPTVVMIRFVRDLPGWCGRESAAKFNSISVIGGASR